MPDEREFERADADLDKMLKYRFRDKERERSNRASGMVEAAQGTARRCLPYPSHQRIAWVGPPWDKVRAYVCLNCHAAASEPEIKDRGLPYENDPFDECPDWIIHDIMNLDLQRQATTNATTFGGLGGLVKP